MASSRKDSRGRVLLKGESQRKDGLYQYRYKDPTKARRTIYDSNLNDLRKKEAKIQKNLVLGSIINELLKLACEDNILPRNPCDFTLSKVIEDTTERYLH